MTSSLNALTQAQRAELRGPISLLLVDIQLATSLLHFSDRSYRYQYGASQILYEPYLVSISGITASLDIWGTGQNNPSLQITLRNDIWGDTPAKLVLLNETQPFPQALVTISELRLITMDEGFSSDIRTVLWKGAIESVGTITEQSFILTCSTRLYAKRNALGLQKLTAASFASADNADIGQYRNILYGDLEFVPARCLVTGGGDTLALAMTVGQTTATVSGTLRQPVFSASGTIQIDMEQMTYSAYNTTTHVFTITARGVNGTTAAAHIAGAYAYQVLSAFVYEVAQHPVKAITAVYVDGILQPAASYTAYTGQVGNQYLSYGAVALIVFNVNPKKGVAQQINVGVNYGSHTHANQSNSQVTVQGASASGNSYVTNPGNACDGNDSTYARVGNAVGNAILTVTMAGGNAGQLVSAEVHINWSLAASAYNNNVVIKLGTATVATVPGPAGITAGNYSYTTSDIANFDWTSHLTVTYNSASGSYSVEVFDVFIIYTFLASLAANTDTSQVSTAQMVVGGQVTIMCQGYQDDGSGTYTGTPAALITQPDAVIKHILRALLGFVAGDIGALFATSATAYAAASYAFAFILHDIATDAQTLLADLAQECRSAFWDWAGQFQLRYLPDSIPPADGTMDPNVDVIGLCQFDYTGTANIKNVENIYYRRDYRASASGAGLGQSSVNLNALAVQKGYMDMQIVTYGAGDLPEDLELKAVRLVAMALSVGNYILDWKQLQKRTLTVTARWNMIVLAPGNVVSLTDAIYGGNRYLITDFTPHAPDLGQVQMTADFIGAGA